MNFLKYKDNALATVSIGYDASATSIVLSGGHGEKLSSIFPYDLVWWNTTDYNDPTDDPNREIVQVTNKSTDTLTVVRGQQGIAASTKNTSGKTYKIAQILTAGDWNDNLKYFDSPENSVYFFDDFISANLNNLATDVVGAGNSATLIPSEIQHPGIVQLISGGGGSNSIKLFLGNKTIALNDCYLENVFYLRPVSFSNGRIFAGLDDSTNSTNTNKNAGIYFISDPDAYANGNWRFLVRNNGSTTETLDTGTAVTANKWYKLQFKCYSASYVDVFINDSLAGRVTTNIPVFPNLLGCSVVAGDNAGAVTVDIDGIELVMKIHGLR